MNTRSVLLAYATRYGSTQEVAETIATARAWANTVSAQFQHAEVLSPA